MTQYIIIKWDEGRWVHAVEASSARRAIAAAELGEGTYVAIPKRSVKPLTVTVEQTTKTTIA